MLVENTTFEKHHRIGDLAHFWGLASEVARKLVRDDPGAVKIRMGRERARAIDGVAESAAQQAEVTARDQLVRLPKVMEVNL